jgi:hypothetical protein
LTERARAALDATIVELSKNLPPGADFKGPVFGEHDYTTHIRRAALGDDETPGALPRELAERFCGAHLRSARITHLLDRGANLPGVQHLAGHRQMSTTARYVRPSFRSALDALKVET